MALPPSRNLFSPFHLIDPIPYTYIRSQALPLSILIPKSITSSSGPRPILVNLHGGGLLTGTRLFEPFYATWVTNLALSQNAILIAPDYPLAPESKSPEMLSALKDFMTWVLDGSLQKVLDEHTSESSSSTSDPLAGLNVKANLKRLLLIGESAGGWGALHLSLLYPEHIRGVILKFPMVDLGDEYWTKPNGTKEIMGVPVGPRESLDEHVKDMTPGKIVAEGGPERGGMAFSVLGHGRVLEAVGREEEETYVLRGIKQWAKLPGKMWILHGENDQVVPTKGSKVLVEKIKEFVPETDVRLDTRPGDHGLDTMWTVENEPLVKERLAWLEESWLA